MSDFHCPVGAPVLRGEDCVDCGMCTATTKEEVIAATKRVGEYIRSISAARREKKAIRKIAICGKGGSGKSTISAMIAHSLVDCGYRPLLIDTDDSNDGTNYKLGIDFSPASLMNGMERFGLDQTIDMSWLSKDPLAIAEIPPEFIVESQGVKFMSIGKIENPFQGCSCSLGELVKELMLNLDSQEDEIVLADQDAGVESFGRGVEQGCDTVIAVVEPSRDSLLLASKFKYMSEGLGIRRFRVIMNKISGKKQFKLIRSYLADEGIRWLGQLGEDEGISMRNLMGETLAGADAQEEMLKITRLMLDEAEMDYEKGELQ